MRVHVLVIAFFTFFTSLATAVNGGLDQGHLQQAGPKATPKAYSVGDPVPIACLNRTIDTGEHVEDEYTGQLQYVPFPVCNETGRPLELYFGTERDVNCTIDALSDEFYHLLEFYIHNDAPLTCRVPAKPLPRSFTDLWNSHQFSLDGEEQILYTPLTISLTGMLQLSHLHLAHRINVLLHAAPRRVAPGTIDAATAYSVSPADPARAALTKVVIGQSLPLQLAVRWYPDTQLPPSWSGVGGHFYLSTLFYCLLSAGASAAVCVSYFRGVELPRRLRNYGRDRLGISLPAKVGGEFNGGLVRYNGYGYGVGSPGMNGWGGPGKRD